MWDFFHPFDLRQLRSRKLPDHAVSQPIRTWSHGKNDAVVKIGDRIEKYGQVIQYIVSSAAELRLIVCRREISFETDAYAVMVSSVQEFIWTERHQSSAQLDPLREIGDTAADRVLSAYTLTPQVRRAFLRTK